VNFSVNTELLDDIAVIDLTGEVDLYTAPDFKQHLLKQIEAGVLKIVVDFSETTFIDSTTLGVLVGGVKRLRPVGGSLVLVCSDRNIIKIFEITGLHRVFDIHSSREDALEALRAATPAS
jgi:anti-sigma B factor antagonist